MSFYKKIVQFLRECRVELLEKTIWPSKNEAITKTVIVFISIIVVSFCLYFFDFVSGWLIDQLLVENVDIIYNQVNLLFKPILGLPIRFLGVVFLFFLLVFIYFKVKSRRSF